MGRIRMGRKRGKGRVGERKKVKERRGELQQIVFGHHRERGDASKQDKGVGRGERRGHCSCVCIRRYQEAT